MKKLFGLFLLLFTVTGFSANIAINVDPGQSRFLIALPANPSTGYQWSIKGYDRAVINMIHSEYRAPNQPLIGSGGTMYYTFEVIGTSDLPATTIITFEYGRPWEKTAIKQKQVVVVNFALSP